MAAGAGNLELYPSAGGGWVISGRFWVISGRFWVISGRFWVILGGSVLDSGGRLRLPLPSAPVAAVAAGALRPDLGARAGARMEAEGAELRVSWVSPCPRALRGALTSFLELLGLVLETMERWGGGAPGLRPPPPAPPPASPPRPSPPNKRPQLG
ncbi:EKC/KEOPS complex subunit LAGE3 [Patagioenas fasciata]|uniref:EKC/KEOPS complex subunit LAGE3 n=1 Tax=Patagioenas fasciata TaxID=372321 RepID=UPI003A999E4F